MSPLWRDEVGAFVSPDQVVLNRMRRGIRPRPVASECVAVQGDGFNNWAQTLKVLESVLRNPTWQAANARVVIADCWVRYAIVPPVRGLSGQREREAHARILMSQSFGEMSDGWCISLSSAGSESALLACAMPAALLEAVRECIDGAGLKLLSVQPQLVVAFNVWRDALPKDCGWFVSLNAGSLAAARITAQGWQQVRCVRIGDDWAAELRRLQTFGRLASSGLAGGKVCVDAPLRLRAMQREPAAGLEMLEHNMERGQGTLEKLVALKGLHL